MYFRIYLWWDDLQMKEVEVWENVLKWGLAQNPTLIPDPSTWTDDDFKKMKITLQNCIPLIRFFCLSAKEFSYKVRPYQKLLNNHLYEDLLNFYLDPDSISTYNIFLPRKIISTENIAQIIDSQIVDSSIVSTITSRIDKTAKSKFEYKFELLLRGSRDGTEEIIGGYNPLKWESYGKWIETKATFIFSFKNKNTEDTIISNVENAKYALFYDNEHGPCFGSGIAICASSEYVDYDNISCGDFYYEKSIRETANQFYIEDYEHGIWIKINDLHSTRMIDMNLKTLLHHLKTW
ncbi:hypothetical protein GLOIN_2v1868410 [Rhizophagus irregularis DAOM 181602=DAOM 197198]|nr:hypothetical protein GLOIN_2v1868410 [Rhizophagus irregularis DAOM 181602=DAOM 197198]